MHPVFFGWYGALRDLHSFPTRRSSDLSVPPPDRFKVPLCTLTVPLLLSSVEIVEVARSEEHTSELQSRDKVVCRLLLETKNGVKICDAELMLWSLKVAPLAIAKLPELA